MDGPLGGDFFAVALLFGFAGVAVFLLVAFFLVVFFLAVLAVLVFAFLLLEFFAVFLAGRFVVLAAEFFLVAFDFFLELTGILPPEFSAPEGDGTVGGAIG